MYNSEYLLDLAGKPLNNLYATSDQSDLNNLNSSYDTNNLYSNEPVGNSLYSSEAANFYSSTVLSNPQSQQNPASVYNSAVEGAIVNSDNPIVVKDAETINVAGQSGLWLNKVETENWKGSVPLSSYKINQDFNPKIIKKKPVQKLTYVQNVGIRYLKPPTPPPPGDIIITQEPNKVMSPAPPVIIRQQPPRPKSPQPIVIREAPPAPPPQIGTKHITIPGKVIPQQERRLVIERLPAEPGKPPSIIIERWLPFEKQRRKIVFQPSNDKELSVIKDPLNPKNIIIQSDAPQIQIRKSNEKEPDVAVILL